MGKPIEQCCCHLGIPEHAGPLREDQVRGDHYTGSLVQLGQQMK
jgi:hypothetical protein